MNEIAKWWNTWAPIWEHMEERHMGSETISKIYSQITSPVLVIGAGQGVLMKYLIKKGFIVDGIDLNDNMISHAKKRNNIKIIKADAKKLPFKNNSYKTVIISSGVVDYIEDEALISKIINEAYRVTSPNGNMFVAFYLENEALEKIYKNLGVIANNKLYHKRIFAIDQMVNSSFTKLKPIPHIVKWSKRNIISIFIYWTFIGITRPKVLFDERNTMFGILDQAKKHKLDPDELINSIPDEVPYKDFNTIKTLLNRLSIRYNSLVRYRECALATFYKSSLHDLITKKTNKAENKKRGIIKTVNLCKKYKGTVSNAVDNLNITIPKGTIFGLLGPNGAGKTTTLSMLTGLIKPSSGEIIFGEELSSKKIKNLIGYVPQDLALFQRMTANENLEFFGKMYNLKGRELKEKIDSLLSLVGLSARKNNLVKNFSTGMMRRLNLAVGLINAPKLILMDEPTVGIDPQSRNCIYEAVLNLKKEGTTILYTTHYMDEATKLCDVVAIIDHGRIVIEGNPKELIKKYGFNKIRYKINSRYNNRYYDELLKYKKISDFKITENELELSVFNKEDLFKVIEKIEEISKKNKVKISLLNMTEPNLESLFLDITGKHLRDIVEEAI
jgi:ABC-2 type transport system ATP-binding protein